MPIGIAWLGYIDVVQFAEPRHCVFHLIKTKIDARAGRRYRRDTHLLATPTPLNHHPILGGQGHPICLRAGPVLATIKERRTLEKLRKKFEAASEEAISVCRSTGDVA